MMQSEDDTSILLRRSKHGQHAGKNFWRCIQYEYEDAALSVQATVDGRESARSTNGGSEFVGTIGHKKCKTNTSVIFADLLQLTSPLSV